MLKCLIKCFEFFFAILNDFHMEIFSHSPRENVAVVNCQLKRYNKIADDSLSFYNRIQLRIEFPCRSVDGRSINFFFAKPQNVLLTT